MGGQVERLVGHTVLNSSGVRLRDSIFVLTLDRTLYRCDLDPFQPTPVLVARDVWDFAIRDESVPIAGGSFPPQRSYTTSIYAAIGEIGGGRSGQLLRISAVNNVSSVFLDTITPNFHVRGVAADSSRLFLTLTPVRSATVIGGSSYDELNAQIQSTLAPAHSGTTPPPVNFQTIVDRSNAGPQMEGRNLRISGQRLYWYTGNSIWRVASDAQPIERDFEAVAVEVVQTTQDLSHTTRLVANKPTVARGYARVARDSSGAFRYRPNARLHGRLNGVPLPGSPLSPSYHPTVGITNTLGTFRSHTDQCFLFDLPNEWVQHGHLLLDFVVNPDQGIPETGISPLANNSVSTGPIDVIRMGSPCLVFIPIHTHGPQYDPTAPDSEFAGILARAQSLLPVNNFRFAIKTQRISKPTPRIRLAGGFLPYPVIDMDPFDLSDSLLAPLVWLTAYTSFQLGSKGCEDTHYVGMFHGQVPAARPGIAIPGVDEHSGVLSSLAKDSVVQMTTTLNRASRTNLSAWTHPLGGRTLAHELAHNYTLPHVDQTGSQLECGGTRPDWAGHFPYDPCTIGLQNPVHPLFELSHPSTQFGFDPLSWSAIAPQSSGDLMSYGQNRWTSKYTLDRLISRIPGHRAATQHQFDLKASPIPSELVLVSGTIDLRNKSGVFYPAYRLPAAHFDPGQVENSMNSMTNVAAEHAWRLRWLDPSGALLGEVPLQWFIGADGDREEGGFVQFVPDTPLATRLLITHENSTIAETPISQHSPRLHQVLAGFDPQTKLISASWTASDLDHDVLSFTLLFSSDNGVTWETIQTGHSDIGFVSDARLFPGGEVCRFRVLVSDGYHGDALDSQPFHLPRNAPILLVDGIRSGDRIPFGQSLRITVGAFDPEDGGLDPEIIRWMVSGAQPQIHMGSSFLLRDLPPGHHQLEVSATDSDGQTTTRSFEFEILPVPVASTPVPILDGDCGDVAYQSAPVIRLDLEDGQFAHARVIRAGGSLYACVCDLLPGDNVSDPADIGLTFDLRTDTAAPVDEGDLVGFHANEFGFPFTTEVGRRMNPPEGFSVAVERGDKTWSAELQIAEHLLGGWDRVAPFSIHHRSTALAAATTHWPPGASQVSPDGWSRIVLGSVTSRANQAPFAIASYPSTVVVADGQVVVLDGAASTDPDGDPIQHQWVQVRGPNRPLYDSETAFPFFHSGSVEGPVELEFQLIVRDATMASSPANLMITLLPRPEVAPPTSIWGVPAIDPDLGVTFKLLWPGSSGDRCRIQASRDLIDWIDIGFAHADFLGQLDFTDLTPTWTDYGFYRAVSALQEPLASPRHAIELDGVKGYVEVNDHDQLNTYPISVTAWIRTDHTSNAVHGIVSKYINASANGYSLFLYQGRLRGWYFHSLNRSIWEGTQGLDGGWIADGEWHHIALVVDAAGGRLYVDAVVVASLPWRGTPGSSTTTAPLQFGRYDLGPATLPGQIDEVSIWSVALSDDDISALRSRGLVPGGNAGLLAFWQFDEGEGVTTSDAGASSLRTLLKPGTSWIPSTLP
jgi:hypothetical protein